MAGSGESPAAAVAAKAGNDNGADDAAAGMDAGDAPHCEEEEEASSEEGEKPEDGGAPLGANARRRLRKEQQRDERRAQQREWRREKRQRQKRRRCEANQEKLSALTPEERLAAIERRRQEGREQKAAKLASLQQAFDAGRPKVVINCSFGDTMALKELSSLAKQVQLSYTYIRDALAPLQLHLTSVAEDNPAWKAFEDIGLKGWLVHVHPEAYWELFPGERVVVLSPDAEEDLEEVEEDVVYVIGGIVDRSVTKMQSLQQALSHQVPVARRLPIKKHGPPGAHPVLNIDVVVQILNERLRRRGDWLGVLTDCLPLRYSGAPTGRMRRKERAVARRQAGQGQDAAVDGQEAGSASDSDPEQGASGSLSGSEARGEEEAR